MSKASLLVDTHAHLCSPEFAHDLGDVLLRAERAGVGAVVAVGETLSDAARNVELSRSHPLIRPAAGLYPTVLDNDQAQTMHAFIRAHRSDLAAIGK
jgi:TatD DNase family protein